MRLFICACVCVRVCCLSINLLYHKCVNLWIKMKKKKKKFKKAFPFEVVRVQRATGFPQQFSNKVKSQSITGALNPDIQRPAKRERQARLSRRQLGVYTAFTPREHCSLQ